MSESLPDPQRSRVVLIGTARYRHMPDLPSVANNVTALRAIITDPALFGLAVKYCTTILDPSTPGQVLEPVRRAAREAEDTLIVYFSGHGHQEEEDFELYLGLKESRPESPENSLAYPMLRREMRRTRARRRVIILDSCFSGLAMGAMSGVNPSDPALALAGQAAVEGAYLMCSASRTALALAKPGERYTAFTGELVNVLRSGVEGGPDYITLDYAFQQVRDRLMAKARPRPRKQALDDIGGLALVRNQRSVGHRETQAREYSEDYHRIRQQPLRLGGRFELGSVLGRGGMAEVYRAHDTRLGRTVAVKTLRADLARDPSFQARFRREAQSAASLSHPAIVAVYDTREDYVDGVSIPYVVMEYVDGATLRELLHSGRKLLPERTLALTVGILQALEYSHRAQIVHRDIKPANVMLTRAGQVKVMNFGIARAMGDSDMTTTQMAAVIGTASYLSPEQAMGGQVDARSDLYSAGCLLYELLSVRPPFVGHSLAVAYQHAREEPQPPSNFDPEITPEIDAIVLKALTKAPAHRYQSAGEMAAAIQRVLGPDTPWRGRVGHRSPS